MKLATIATTCSLLYILYNNFILQFVGFILVESGEMRKMQNKYILLENDIKMPSPRKKKSGDWNHKNRGLGKNKIKSFQIFSLWSDSRCNMQTKFLYFIILYI